MMRRLRHESSGRVLAGLIVTMGLLVPLAVFGAPAFARTGASASQYQYSSSAQYQYGRTKLLICHFTHSKKHPYRTLRVSWAGWWYGHSKHARDHKGACAGNELLLWKKTHGHKGHGQGASANANTSSHGPNGHANGHAKTGHGPKG